MNAQIKNRVVRALIAAAVAATLMLSGLAPYLQPGVRNVQTQISQSK